MNDSTWSWISGSNGLNDLGTYGERGIADSSYTPRARENPAAWYDSVTQEFWLFGGEAWDYDVSTCVWLVLQPCAPLRITDRLGVVE